MTGGPFTMMPSLGLRLGPPAKTQAYFTLLRSVEPSSDLRSQEIVHFNWCTEHVSTVGVQCCFGLN
jgi:hypothetical protein